jgi:hypothetical protein
LAGRTCVLDRRPLVVFVDLPGAAAFFVAFRRVVLRVVTCFAVFRAALRFVGFRAAVRLAEERGVDFFAWGIVSPNDWWHVFLTASVSPSAPTRTELSSISTKVAFVWAHDSGLNTESMATPGHVFQRRHVPHTPEG